MTPTSEHPNDLSPEEIVLDLPEQFTTSKEAFATVTKLAVSILRHAKISALGEIDSDTEAVFDDFTAQFQRITHFAQYVLQKDQELRDSDGPRLQYGMGLMMALFYSATRCRNFFVRREAIAILREWPYTNGIWHSLQTAKVAEWIISIEEERCSGLEFVLGECRVKLQSLRVALKKGVIAVECMQWSADGALEPRKANLTWP
ncbi:mercuric reductase [Fusarium agapanthi]|uniref:Mercuric reductase n=1 Tax=Fusarium agapanthi TaxID=1803897 RepID=A0A9P5BK49_9HYPO|nr:mercuric reductase [Fusarium agapanthi]